MRTPLEIGLAASCFMLSSALVAGSALASEEPAETTTAATASAPAGLPGAAWLASHRTPVQPPPSPADTDLAGAFEPLAASEMEPFVLDRPRSTARLGDGGTNGAGGAGTAGAVVADGSDGSDDADDRDEADGSDHTDERPDDTDSDVAGEDDTDADGADQDDTDAGVDDADDADDAPAPAPLAYVTTDGEEIGADRIRAFLEGRGAPLAAQAEELLAAGVEHDVDPRVVVGIAVAESSGGEVLPPGSHNAWGWGGSGPKGLAAWDSWSEAIDTYTERLGALYDTDEVDEAFARTYCPPNWRWWLDTVTWVVDEI